MLSSSEGCRSRSRLALDRAPEAQARVSNVATLQTLVSTSLIPGLVDCSLMPRLLSKPGTGLMAVKRRDHFLAVGPDLIAPHARGLRLADPR
jgi:hypothetical protein